jgi:hypothetical protein
MGRGKDIGNAAASKLILVLAAVLGIASGSWSIFFGILVVLAVLASLIGAIRR